MKIILIAAMSLNGMIAENAFQFVDWSSAEDKNNFKEKTKESGVVVFGNNTFRTFGGNPLPRRLNVVMTRNHEMAQEYSGQKDGIWYTDKTVRQIIETLENSKIYESCYICGGAQIYSLFLGSGVADEIMVTIEPLIIGKGIGIFSGLDQKVRLKLIESKMLNSNSLLLHYVLVKNQ